MPSNLRPFPSSMWTSLWHYILLWCSMVHCPQNPTVYCDPCCDSGSLTYRHAEQKLWERFMNVVIVSTFWERKCIAFIILGHCKSSFCLICTMLIMTKCSDLQHFVKASFYRLWIKSIIIALKHLKPSVNCLMLPAFLYYIFHAIDLWMNNGF